jgi:hypothetical protein
LAIIIAPRSGTHLPAEAQIEDSFRQSRTDGEKQKNRLAQACPPAAQYDRLKAVAFAEAVRIRNSDPQSRQSLPPSVVNGNSGGERAATRIECTVLHRPLRAGAAARARKRDSEASEGSFADIEYAAQASATAAASSTR